MKALDWISREHTGKNGVEMTAKFAKIPRMERKAQNGREGVDEARQQEKVNQSTKTTEEVKPESNKEANKHSELEQQINGSHLQQKQSNQKMQHDVTPQSSVLRRPSTSAGKSNKNSKQKKKKGQEK